MDEQQAERYDRNICLTGFGRKGQEKLLSSSVLVIGTGGLGCAAINYLVAAGTGRVAAADYDTVDITNLQRQILHYSADLGKNKADSAKEKMEMLNPDVKFEVFKERITSFNAEGLINKYDFIIDAADNFRTKYIINEACVKGGKPFSHAGVLGFEGQAMTYVPGSPCLVCSIGPEPPAEECPDSRAEGILGAAAGHMGTLQAAEAIKYLSGTGKILSGQILKIDLYKMKYILIKTDIDPRCPVCGYSAGRGGKNYE